MGTDTQRSAAWGLALVLALGLGLRCYHLTERSLWFDEAFSWRMTRYPLGEMLRRISTDNTLPLHYVLLKYWTACFGDSVAALRSLSVVLGGLTVAAMFLFVRAAAGGRAAGGRAAGGGATEAALVAALLVAVSSFQVRWSWDARSYSLGAALALLSSWALFRALQAGGEGGRWWCGYAALAVLFAYAHYFALFTLAAQGGFVLYALWLQAGGSLRRMLRAPATRRAALAYGLIALCWLPWLPIFLRQQSQVRAHFWIKPFEGWNLPHTLYQMFVEPEHDTLTETRSLWTLDLCVLGWLLLLWSRRPAAVYVAAAALAPLGLSILLSYLGMHLFLLRYFLFAHVFFLAGLALLVRRIPFVIERRLLAGVLVGLGLFAWSHFWEKADFPGHPGARAAADWIAARAGPDDPVVVSSPFYFLSMRYHLRDRRPCYMGRPEGDVPHYLGASVLRPEDVTGVADLEKSGASRVWVVRGVGGPTEAQAPPLTAPWELRRRNRFPEAFRLGDLVVSEYVRPAQPRPYSPGAQ